MKAVLFVVALCALVAVTYGALSEELLSRMMEKVVSVAEECQKETGASQDDMKELLEKKPPSTHEGKCVVSCVGKKLGMGTEDGYADIEGTKKALEGVKAEDEEAYNKLVQAAEQCKDEVPYNEDHCISSAEFAICAQKKVKEIGIEFPFL
uniref:Odorant-binding protein 12 n=1 Tax=Rhyzopertha dominica TaxID=92692 RepID=A0A0X8X428_RHYDO|nr:odorant-binding protein 12 [Rhyzopertha dominica]